MNLRQNLWNKMSDEWKPEHLLNLYNEISLTELDNTLELILKGELKGRTIVRMID